MENLENRENRRRVALVVTGRVQGVFFRRETRREAQKLGLSGWVENRPDGSVRAEAEGPSTQVGALIRWCRRGPAHARVEEVRVTEIPATGSEGFLIRD
ncbi:MAG: acylphosphatase [Fibrobacteria bacterium]|jgi:acylphosphatase|nr:acylphosphatase [Fibrobacteria bacterium]